MHRRPRLSAGLLLAAVTLAGCGDGAVEPLPDADDPACAGVTERAPDTLLGATRGTDAAAGVVVWQSDTGRIVLRCGADPLGPTSAPCVAVDDIDWVFTEDSDPLLFQTFGRTPAVELSVPEGFGREQAPGALGELNAAVRPLASDGNSCE